MIDTDPSVSVISSEPQLVPDIREAWRYRALAFALARRNVKVRYRQTVLGSLWLILQPLLLTGVFTLVLGNFLEVPSGGIPYVLFALAGTTIWSVFQRATNDASISLAASGNIIQKVYFPRLVVPVSAVIAAIADLLPIYAVLLTLVWLLGFFPGWLILASTLFVVLALLLALAIGLWMTVLDAIFRDVRFVTPSILQLVMYLSPVVYSAASVPERWRMLYHLNPAVGLIEGFRWSVIAQAPPPDAFGLAWSCVFVVLAAGSGLIVFARLETFAIDHI